MQMMSRIMLIAQQVAKNLPAILWCIYNNADIVQTKELLYGSSLPKTSHTGAVGTSDGTNGLSSDPRQQQRGTDRLRRCNCRRLSVTSNVSNPPCNQILVVVY